MKPQTTGGDREVLPEGDYPFVVVKWAEETLPDWKQAGAVEWFNRNEAERAEKNADYTAKPVDSFDDLPWHKTGEYVFYLKVREGEHAGKQLPCVYLPLRWNTDKKYRDRSKWFLFCKCIVPELGKRGDVPDLDEEVIGFGATAEVSVEQSKRGTSYNKFTGFRKDDSFGKKVEVSGGSNIPEVNIEDLGANTSPEASEIPFRAVVAGRGWWL